MRIILSALLAALVLATLLPIGLISDVFKSEWPPKGWNQEDYGSFSPDITYSYDEKYYALQTLTRPELAGVDYIQVTVYENGTDAVVDSFLTERAFDFWGVCWEDDTYNIWIQSGDIGTYCMEFDGEKWNRNDGYELEKPPEIIDRFRMRQGSFGYYGVYSIDKRYLAQRDSFDDCVVVCDAPTNTELYRYSLDGVQDFRGVCWDKENNLWLRSGDDVFALRKEADAWVYDGSISRPEEVVLSYNWDGTAG